MFAASPSKSWENLDFPKVNNFGKLVLHGSFGGSEWKKCGITMWLYLYMILKGVCPSSNRRKFGTKYTYSRRVHNKSLMLLSYFRMIRKFQKTKMWDKYSLQFVNTIRDGIEGTKVNVITLTHNIIISKERFCRIHYCKERHPRYLNPVLILNYL